VGGTSLKVVVLKAATIGAGAHMKICFDFDLHTKYLVLKFNITFYLR